MFSNLRIGSCQQMLRLIQTRSCSATTEKFSVLSLRKVQPVQTRKTDRPHTVWKAPGPRYKKQKTDQYWGSVWPAARTFHPAVVPLPIRQGVPQPDKPTPDKWGNAELMKIPNFLHLTPPVIKKQCDALKRFCSPWPEGLESEEEWRKYFPVTIIKSSYLHSSTSIRDPRARVVTLTVPLSSLALDDHGRDKLLRLVGDRYDPKTDLLTLTADRCPLSTQNQDYCEYLLIVLYSESVKVEPWEHEKAIEDREKYIWEDSPSKRAVDAISEAKGSPLDSEVVKEYSDVVTHLHNEGEDPSTLSRYKEAVLRLLALNA